MIDSFDEENFPDLPNLEYLNLRENPINKIEDMKKINKFQSQINLT